MSFSINPANGMLETGLESGAASVAIRDNFREMSRRAPYCNYLATTAPGTANNTTQGYHPGSKWLNMVTGLMYECLISTSLTATWRTYSATGHAHVIGDVTGLQAALDGKSA